MKTVYIVLDDVAVGPMDIDETAELLSEVQKRYPEAKTAVKYDNVVRALSEPRIIIVSTKDDGKGK